MAFLVDLLIVVLAAVALAEVASGRPLAPWRRGQRDRLAVRGQALSTLLVMGGLAAGLWWRALPLAWALLGLAVVVLLGAAAVRARQPR